MLPLVTKKMIFLKSHVKNSWLTVFLPALKKYCAISDDFMDSDQKFAVTVSIVLVKFHVSPFAWKVDFS